MTLSRTLLWRCIHSTLTLDATDCFALLPDTEEEEEDVAAARPLDLDGLAVEATTAGPLGMSHEVCWVFVL